MVQLSESQIGKIGFFGGTFDPPHNGHLSLLQFALDEFALDRVLLSPSFSTSFKNAPLYTPQQRLHMVEKLAKLHPGAMVFDYEISQTKLSYTYDSILEVRKLFPRSKIHLLIGYDQFKQLTKWKFLKELSEEVHFLVFKRDGTPNASPPISISYSLMKNPLINISSSIIRSRIRDGKSIEGLVPPAIFSYLQSIIHATQSNSS